MFGQTKLFNPPLELWANQNLASKCTNSQCSEIKVLRGTIVLKIGIFLKGFVMADELNGQLQALILPVHHTKPYKI